LKLGFIAPEIIVKEECTQDLQNFNRVIQEHFNLNNWDRYPFVAMESFSQNNVEMCGSVRIAL
jgi:hypothetical protein